MAKSTNNVVLSGVSGSLGPLVIRQVRGKIILSVRPGRRKKTSTRQQAVQDRFSEASQYAKEAMENTDLWEQYKKGVKGNLFSARQVAISDYLNAPVVEAVDMSEYNGEIGDVITIKAHDDFRVAGVRVSILVEGIIAETGDAVENPVELQWYYTAKTAIKPGDRTVTIRAQVSDLAENVTTRETYGQIRLRTPEKKSRGIKKSKTKKSKK
jgi:hypothetical protein